MPRSAPRRRSTRRVRHTLAVQARGRPGSRLLFQGRHAVTRLFAKARSTEPSSVPFSTSQLSAVSAPTATPCHARPTAVGCPGETIEAAAMPAGSARETMRAAAPSSGASAYCAGVSLNSTGTPANR